MAYSRSSRARPRSYSNKNYSKRTKARSSTRVSRYTPVRGKKTRTPAAKVQQLSRRIAALEVGDNSRSTTRAHKQQLRVVLPSPLPIWTGSVQACRLPITAAVPSPSTGQRFLVTGYELSFTVSFLVDIEVLVFCHRINGVALGKTARTVFKLGSCQPDNVQMSTEIASGSKMDTFVVEPTTDTSHLPLDIGNSKPLLLSDSTDGTIFTAPLCKENILRGVETTIDRGSELSTDKKSVSRSRSLASKSAFFLATPAAGSAKTREVRLFWDWSKTPVTSTVCSATAFTAIYDTVAEGVLAIRPRSPDKTARQVGALSNISSTV